MEEQNKEVIGLKPIIVNYFFHWKLFLVAFLISLVGAILYLFLWPTTFEIRSSIQLQEDKSLASGSLNLGEAAGFMKSFGLGGLSSSSISLEDEIAIFKTNSLLKKVALDLGLNVTYQYPYSFYKLYDDSPLKLVPDPEMLNNMDEEVKMKVTVGSNNIEIVVKSKKGGEKSYQFPSLPANIDFNGAKFYLDFNSSVKVNPPYKLNLTYSPAGWFGETLVDDILIEDISKTSRIIDFSYRDHNILRGKDILNTLIQYYDNQSRSYKMQEASKSLAFVTHRIDSVVDELNKTERIIANFKNTNKLTAIESDVLFYVDQMRDLQLKIIELEAQTHILELMKEFIKNPENKYNLVPVLLSTSGDNETGNSLGLYNEVLLERSRVIQNSNINNPLVKTLTERADQLRESVFLTIENANQSLNLGIHDLRSKETALLRKMGEYPVQEMDYIDLKRQQEIFQGIYLILLQKQEELLLTIGENKSTVRIIDSAYILKKPVGPRKLYAAIGLLIFTILIPITYLFIKEQIVSLLSIYRDKINNVN